MKKLRIFFGFNLHPKTTAIVYTVATLLAIFYLFIINNL